MLMPKETPKNNSRYVEPEEAPKPYVQEVAEQEAVGALPIDTAGRDEVNAALEKHNTAYKYYNLQNIKVRAAQGALRQHHSLYGENNAEYTRLANELNTATQEMNSAKTDYQILKSVWENAKKRFGKNVTF